MFYWIAFNALYGQAQYLTEDWQGEETSIHAFLGKMARLCHGRPGLQKMLDRMEADLVDLLKNQFLRQQYWTRGFTDSVDKRLHAAEGTVRKALGGVGSLATLLIEVFDCLYVLRIQLFHGCAKDVSSANRASLEPAVAVVKRLVPLFWATMKATGLHEEWGPLSYPAWGRPGHPQENRPRCFVRH